MYGNLPSSWLTASCCTRANRRCASCITSLRWRVSSWSRLRRRRMFASWRIARCRRPLATPASPAALAGNCREVSRVSTDVSGRRFRPEREEDSNMLMKIKEKRDWMYWKRYKHMIAIVTWRKNFIQKFHKRLKYLVHAPQSLATLRPSPELQLRLLLELRLLLQLEQELELSLKKRLY